jgi:hypothetical protein
LKPPMRNKPRPAGPTCRASGGRPITSGETGLVMASVVTVYVAASDLADASLNTFRVRYQRTA